MPELPEVEIVRRGLAPVLTGHTVVGVTQRRKDLRFPLPARFASRLEGRRVHCVSRRAKYILAELDSEEVLVLHLGMSGRLTVSRPSSRDGPSDVLGRYMYDTGSDPAHDHVEIAMSNGAVITYNDPRRFGCMLLIPRGDVSVHPLFRNLGLEPLLDSLDADYLASRARNRRSDLKSFLLDQRHVAGLGNIYVCEALHRAGLSPKRKASTLAARSRQARDSAQRVVTEIKSVLTEAIAAGGSTLRDYRHADGTIGSFQQAFAVYGREGQPCVRTGCGGAVRRITQAGRSTFFCPRCQR